MQPGPQNSPRLRRYKNVPCNWVLMLSWLLCDCATLKVLQFFVLSEISAGDKLSFSWRKYGSWQLVLSYILSPRANDPLNFGQHQKSRWDWRKKRGMHVFQLNFAPRGEQSDYSRFCASIVLTRGTYNTPSPKPTTFCELSFISEIVISVNCRAGLRGLHC